MEVAVDVPSYVKCREKCGANLIANRCYWFSRNIKEVPDEELFAPGHRACAGCASTIAIRLALKALGKNTIASESTGCMEVVSSPYPEVAWRIPWIHVAFENSAAVASGIEAGLKALGRKEGVNVVAFGGDGGTVDIGLQALSGAMERGHDMTYICYDNEAYMNTGVQRSGATPFGASTTTSPAGKVSFGEDRPKKDIPHIIAAHGVPYVATASVAFPLDYMKKVKKAASIKGPCYIHVHAPCPPGWGSASEKSIEIARLAVDTGMWVLYEIEDGKTKITYKPTQKVMVKDYLKLQRRFRHLSEEMIDKIQDDIDRRWKELFE
ncbi:MAG: pyruvate synthase subunit PorB [Candidatus Hydrothermarchaeales archaeon]